MSKILIEQLFDEKQPELPSDPSYGFYASGARVHIDDLLAIELIPKADRDGGTHYENRDIYSAIFAHLNIPVIEAGMKTVPATRGNPAVTIKWLSDSNDCETCGGSWAEGASIRVGGRKAFELTPVAHCFGGASYNEDQVFDAILAHYGHEILPGDELVDE